LLLFATFGYIINGPPVGKKLTIFLIIVLVAGLAIMVYFLQQGRKDLFTDPYKSISPKAAVIIETVDLQSFINSLATGKGLFGEVAAIKEFDVFNQKLKFIADQLNKSAFSRLKTDGPAIISYYPESKGKSGLLLSMSVTGELRGRHIKEMLRNSGVKSIIDSRLNNYPVFKIPYTINSQKDTVYLSLIPGLLLCSNAGDLLNEAVNQLGQQNDVRMLPGFSRVLIASGKNEDKLFVVFENLAPLFSNIMAGEGKKLIPKISKLAGTASGDVYINEDGLALSGYTETKDSLDLLYRYKFAQPRELHTYKILPSSTVLFETLLLPGDNDIKMAGKNEAPKNAVDLADKLMAFTGGEITRAYIDIKDSPVADNTLVIYELNNRVEAERIFLENIGSAKQVSYFQPDDQTKIPVYKTSFSGLSGVMLPGFVPGFNDTFFAFYDNFLISGNSFATISRLLYDNILNKTLANDLVYRDFESTLPSRAGYFFFCVPSRIINYLAGYLNENLIKALTENKKILAKIQAVGYQISSSNGMIYNSLSVRYKEVAREESNTEWETLLDTTACIKPFFFTNHITGAKEIFIQDLRNNVYLINAAGRVLWKVPLNERIESAVFMIDYYRNGKYQLLFSGHNYLHILDRNGNYVERYPVKLRSPATNSLALFDYDNNLNYRLFIAGEDKNIYSYDKTGNVVKGWNLFRTAGLVNSEVNYFRVSGKDYIVVADEKSIYFLDRRGNIRVNLKEPVTRAKGSAMRLTPGSEQAVVCSSPDGTVQYIYFDGTVKKFSMKKFSVDHSFDIFDIDGDGFGEYIFIDKGILYLYNHNRAEIFKRDFESDDLGGPINFIFSGSDRKIGVFDTTRNLIYLIGKKGETMKGFPLKGASMFSIGKLSDRSGWHLIVGGTDRFLYNYKIDTDVK
jgi:hypothetical protein